jgi:hypothetical protein
MATVGLEGVEFPLNLRGYRWVSVVDGLTLFPAGRQRVTGCGIEDPADFCRKMAAVFGAEVYRNSTEGSALGKSAGKDFR